ncbi:5-methylaminomethyl-2-thiouridylate-methyltransferase [Pholiota conissans]|uniref:tRNA-5-taurinomethyluridine 2-sulfurtransferase n=1 Tax=Pholiota conissans TaxID=109636 RepID=A0A9P5YS88_9AGAR|nr:5-methylaminomethyl-2-thiouridylate-methyltransferase [Pholiota conissans]
MLRLSRSCTRVIEAHFTRRFASHVARTLPQKGEKVVVGMSGGVDSSVTALLLAQKGFDVSAVYMRNWDTRDEFANDKGCEWEKDWEDVQRVCKQLDLPCELVDLSQQYWNRVFEPSLRDWELGLSPNPDVWCNREIKFGALLERLPQLDKSYQNSWFATGHYASKSWSDSVDNPRPKLLRPADDQKDQTYFMSAISETGLRRALFPLGHLTKPEVREIAKEYRLPTAERRDSVGICFVGKKTKFNSFLSSYITPNPGHFVDKLTGKIVGEHSGIWSFTLGQNARVPGMEQRMFVAGKDLKTNTIYLVPGSTHESLYSHTLRVHDFAWIWKDAPPAGIDSSEGVHLDLQHRYRMNPVSCVARRTDDGDLLIECDQPQHAVTPGQVAALWDGDWCLGSGIITSAL